MGIAHCEKCLVIIGNANRLNVSIDKDISKPTAYAVGLFLCLHSHFVNTVDYKFTL